MLIKFEILPDIKARFGVDTFVSGLFKQEKDTGHLSDILKNQSGRVSVKMRLYYGLKR